MEYFDGVLFLTTNLVHQFDDAILNRIHLMMKYEKLDKIARDTIITRFLESINDGQGSSNLGMGYIDRFASVLLNGRQVSRLSSRVKIWLMMSLRSRTPLPLPLRWRMRKVRSFHLRTSHKLWRQTAISLRNPARHWTMRVSTTEVHAQHSGVIGSVVGGGVQTSQEHDAP